MLEKIALYLFGLILVLFGCCSCINNNSLSNHSKEANFWGDSILTIISSNRPNGYLVKFLMSKDLILMNLSRGDSINQYIAIHEIPLSVRYGSPIRKLTNDGVNLDTIGVFLHNIKIPVEKELGNGMFFMDVNFDGEEDLLIEHRGYNRVYFACFDLVNGNANVSPGILLPMKEEPFNNIVMRDPNLPREAYGDIFTEFDHENKEIHIFEAIGCYGHVETWCKMVPVEYCNRTELKIVKKEEVNIEHMNRVRTTFERVNGELVLVSKVLEGKIGENEN